MGFSHCVKNPRKDQQCPHQNQTQSIIITSIEKEALML